MKVAYIKKYVDYNLNIRGYKHFYLVDGDGNYINMTGYWKSQKACKENATRLGYKIAGVVCEHINYEQWMNHPNFHFA